MQVESIPKQLLSSKSVETFSKAVFLNMDQVQNAIEKAADAVFPYIQQAEKLYLIAKEKTEAYQGLPQMITGFVMMFFGGFFMTTIAVYEAIQQSGGEQFSRNVTTLTNQALKVANANAEDNRKDENDDGVADVLQISATELMNRKFLLFMTSCDPAIVNDALHGLYLILLASAATLRSSFARVVSIGSSIGDVLEKSFAKFVLPQIEEKTPEEYRPWAKYAGIYLCRWIAVMIAFRIQRILSTVHSAYKGAREFTDGLNLLAKSQGKEQLTEGYFDEALAGFLAIAGVYLQLFFWSQLPLVIKLLFFPAFIVESILKTLVSPVLYSSSGVAK